MITDYKVWIKIVELHNAGDSDFAIACKLDITQFRVRQLLDSHNADKQWNKEPETNRKAA